MSDLEKDDGKMNKIQVLFISLFLLLFFGHIIYDLIYQIIIDNKKLNSPNRIVDENGNQAFIETQFAIKLIANNQNISNVDIGKKYESRRSTAEKRGRYWGYENAGVFLKECTDTIKIDDFFTNVGFHNLNFYVSNKRLNGYYCIGDVKLNISAPVYETTTNTDWGKICGKVSMEYYWHKGQNLNETRCWDKSIKSTDNEQ